MNMAESLLTNAADSIDFSQEERECPQSLYDADYSSYRANVASHHLGTLQWILEHKCYEDWIDSTDNTKSQLLWISGNPGCGKTVLSKFLLSSVERSLRDKLEPDQLRRSHVIYFFFDDKYSTQRTAASFLKGLLHQLIQFVPDLIRHIMPYYVSHGSGLTQSLGSLWNIFCAVTADSTLLDGIYLIVDALDECEETSRENLMTYFEQYFIARSSEASSSTFLKILVTSRPYPKIERLFQSMPCIRLRTGSHEGRINKDIEAFIS
jgi:hypothetical protein